MASTKMIQKGCPLSQALPRTPPSTPKFSPSEHVVTLNSVQQFIDMVQAVVAMKPASAPATKCRCSHTSLDCPDLDSPHPSTPAKPITVQDLEHLFLKLFDKRAEDNAQVSDNPKLDSPDDTRSKEVVARASVLAFKEVDET
jgi:hypothetical protein